MKRILDLVIGKARNPRDKQIFHKLSLIAFFAWVGLGADGLSSSCYGPQEAFLALNGHTYLSILVALGSVLTIFVISASYSQIIELFPTGGGGYLVASKLLSPGVGMVSGCALLIDYVLTIAVSITSGADAVFSLFPPEWQQYRFGFTICIVFLMMVLNMRGMKESILPLVPIFLTFIFTHIFIIIYALATHLPSVPQIAVSTVSEAQQTISQIGIFGMFFLVLRAYSMGAGTYTGIEAVSNGVPALREPKVQTAKRTMSYMAISLAFMVMGLMLAYLFYQVEPQPGKTLNAIFFEKATAGWGANIAYVFIFVTLISEMVLLFVAAQTGFLGGPQVLANMAKDRWFPVKFSLLSDRLVTQNGILIMGAMSVAIMYLAQGSIRFLIVLYSINVFITFSLSQLGMVRHWLVFTKEKGRYKKFIVSGIGLVLTAFILISMLIFKFHEGGWITLLITGALVVVAVLIKRHYNFAMKLLHRLDELVSAAELDTGEPVKPVAKFDEKAKTAVLLVNGFNGLGLHTLFGVIKLFGGVYKNFIFVQVGVVDAGNFKGVQEIENFEAHIKSELGRYVKFMNKQGIYAEGISSIGVDVIEEVDKLAPVVLARFPGAVFFGGQLIFPKDSFVLRVLHNQTVFTLQKMLYQKGVPFVILPIRV